MLGLGLGLGLGMRNVGLGATGPALPLTTYDPANKSTVVTLSEGNRRMVSGGMHKSAKSTSSRSAGKRYFEIKAINPQALTIGVGDAAADVESWVGSGSSTGLDAGADNVNMMAGGLGPAGVGSVNANDVYGFAVDFTAGKIWFARQGAYGSGQDPVAGTGGFAVPAGALFIMTGGFPGADMRIATETPQFSYSPPSGYVPWA